MGFQARDGPVQSNRACGSEKLSYREFEFHNRGECARLRANFSEGGIADETDHAARRKELIHETESHYPGGAGSDNYFEKRSVPNFSWVAGQARK
jgi:hypothetical protein